LHNINAVNIENTQKKAPRKKHSSPAISEDEQQTNLFMYSRAYSIGAELQKFVCQQLGLVYCGDELHSATPAEWQTCRQMQTAINAQTNNQCSVKTYKAIGDGNCLFRALSLGLTGSQRQHDVIRSLIVDHLVLVKQDISSLYPIGFSYDRHLQAMKQPGCWGTEREIIAAANLFGLSIFCYSNYGQNGLRLQLFSPHLILDPSCYSPCSQQSVFLVNSSGNHYNSAIVTTEVSSEEKCRRMDYNQQLTTIYDVHQ
jgi:hypothetical protein